MPLRARTLHRKALASLARLADLEFLELLMGGRASFSNNGRINLGGQGDPGLARADLRHVSEQEQLGKCGRRPVRRGYRAPFAFSLLLWRGTLLLRHNFSKRHATTVLPLTGTGSGTCSHHGGIDHYNAPIGDGAAFELAIGFRVHF